MSYGLLGGISGAAKAGVSYGEAVMKDAFEERREKRLEEAKMRMEMDRRKWETENRQAARQEDFQHTYGINAPTDIGTKELDHQTAVRQQYGQGADPSLGSAHHDNRSAADRTRLTEGAKNEVNQFGGLMSDPTIGAHQKGPDGRIHSIGAGAGGASSSSEARAASEAQLLAQYKASVQHELREILPGEEFANFTVIQGHGGFEGWAPKYREVLEQIPDFYTWRQQVHGIELPPGMQAGNAATGARPSQDPAIPPTPEPEPTTELERGRSMIGRVLDRVSGSSPDQQPAPGQQPAPHSPMAEGTLTNPVRINSQAELEPYPSGTYFVAADGVVRRKP